MLLTHYITLEVIFSNNTIFNNTSTSVFVTATTLSLTSRHRNINMRRVDGVTSSEMCHTTLRHASKIASTCISLNVGSKFVIFCTYW